MNIIHVAPIDFDPSSGISNVIPKIVKYQNYIEGIHSSLLLSKDINSDILEAERQKNNFLIFDKDYIRKFKLEKFNKPFNKPDLMVFHSTYIPAHAILIRKIISLEIPYIILPHGGLTKKAQNRKKIKKKLGNAIFFNKIVKNAEAIQYLSKGESSKSTGFNRNHMVIGNGIDLPNKIKDYNKSEGKLIFTFIGRLDFNNKGIDLLIKASKYLLNQLKINNFIINIYGPEVNGSKVKIVELINKNNLKNHVKLKKPVYGKEKEKVLLNTDIFILLSRHEGLPTSVLEALSYGIPCLLTPGTNLSKEVVANKCGWETSYEIEDIATTMKKTILNNSDIPYLGKNARNYVVNNYSWEKITRTTLENYKKIIRL